MVLVLMMMICHVVTMTVFAIDLYDEGDKKSKDDAVPFFRSVELDRIYV